MKLSDAMNDDERDRLMSDEVIEAALRGLPAPDVPRELEATLVAGIPRAKLVVERRPKRGPYREWLVWSAAIAALLLVTVGIAGWQAAQRVKTVRGAARNSNPAMVAVTLVQTKETDPCNILPPLHDWR